MLSAVFYGRNAAVFMSLDFFKLYKCSFTVYSIIFFKCSFTISFFIFFFSAHAKLGEKFIIIFPLTDLETILLTEHSLPLNLLSVLKMGQSNWFVQLWPLLSPSSISVWRKCNSFQTSYFIEVWMQTFCCKNFVILFLLFFCVNDLIWSFFFCRG